MYICLCTYAIMIAIVYYIYTQTVYTQYTVYTVYTQTYIHIKCILYTVQ